MKSPETELQPQPELKEQIVKNLETARVVFTRNMDIYELLERIEVLREILASEQRQEMDIGLFITGKKITPKWIEEKQWIRKGLKREEKTIRHKIQEWFLEEEGDNLKMRLTMQSGKELVISRPRMDYPTTSKWLRDGLMNQDWVLEAEVDS